MLKWQHEPKSTVGVRSLQATEKVLNTDEGLRDRRQVKGGENRDDRDHAHQFDE